MPFKEQEPCQKVSRPGDVCKNGKKPVIYNVIASFMI
jgi:hypothetical protein